MSILVTGTAGFIGSALALRMLREGLPVVGIDNHNDYYSVALKEARVSRLMNYPNYIHYKRDLNDGNEISAIFERHRPECVVNLAAQAGVRYASSNPRTYISSNLMGFLNVLEGCREVGVQNLVYASSSSVYGANGNSPYTTHESVNHPLNLYAVTKRTNELMAHSYSHLYKISTTGLRFFTVYGPWGRPDMALFKFAEAILSNQPLELYGYGQHIRDFTYIDDIVEGIIRVIARPSKAEEKWNPINPDPANSYAPWKIYNIGNNKPVTVKQYLSALEHALGKKAIIRTLGPQPGDMHATHADIKDFVSDFDWTPTVEIKEGVKNFAEWYRDYYKI
jgi:UDP-glucuronate 4-epimerase